MNCKEAIDFLSDYIDGALAVSIRSDFEQHLSVCRHCREYLDSFRKTIALSRDAFAPQADKPAESLGMPPKLLSAILESRRKLADDGGHKTS